MKTTPPEHKTPKGKHLHYFEPHKDLIMQMQKQERLHQELTDKHTARQTPANQALLPNGMKFMMPVVTLARLEKKWNSLAKKLRKRLGI